MTHWQSPDGTIRLICGDCLERVGLLSPNFTLVLQYMSTARHAAKVVNVIIQGIAVMVVYDAAHRHATKVRLPDNGCSLPPCAGVGSFDECPPYLPFAQANPDSPNRDAIVGRTALYKLCARRKVNPFPVFVPRFIAPGKSVARPFACSSLIAFHCLADNRRQPIFGMPHATAATRTKTRSGGSVILDFKKDAANFACFCDHAGIIADCCRPSSGSGSTDIAVQRCKRELDRHPLFDRVIEPTQGDLL